MGAIFSGLSLPPTIMFLLFIILPCLILLIPNTVKSGFATFVLGNADMPKVVSSPITSFDLLIKPKLSQLTFHIQEYSIPGNNDSIPPYPLYDKTLREICDLQNNKEILWAL
jgi:hypothetical protein